MARRRVNPHLVPDRQWIVTVHLANGSTLTTTIAAPTPDAAEDVSRTPNRFGHRVSRITVHQELPCR